MSLQRRHLSLKPKQKINIVTFPVEITSTKVVNNQRFNNVSTKLQRITKNIESASTWNFTQMICCVEAHDKGLRDNNNVTNIISVLLIFSNFCLLFQVNILDKDLLFIPQSGLYVDKFLKVNSIGVN